MNVKSSSKYTGYQAVQISHQNLLTSFSIYFQNAWIEVKRRWCYYMLSLLSVLIVVTATSTCQTIIDNAPLIFLKTAEGTAAERDIVITPAEFSFEELNSKFYINGNFLNFTRVREVLHPQYSDVVTPRADLMGKYVTVASKEMNCDSFAGFSMNQFRNNQDILKKMQICKYLSMNLRLIDTNIERRMGLGRDYPFDEIPEGSCLIHKKLANYLGVEKNDIIFIDFDMNNTLSTLVERFNFEYKKDMKYEDIQYARFLVPMIIHDIFEESYGKYADGSVETTILAEYKHFFKHSSDFLINFNNSDSNNFKEYLSLQNPFDFAWTIIINYPNRISLYLNSNYDSIQQTLTKQASLISERLGVYPFSMQLPVLEELYPQRFSAMFLGVILNMILFILFLLSVILLYSLLLVSVETKTFDFGVIRVLGLNKIGVIGMILVQSLSYVIPGIVFGLILSIPALLYAKNALNEAIGVSISILPTPYAAG